VKIKILCLAVISAASISVSHAGVAGFIASNLSSSNKSTTESTLSPNKMLTGEAFVYKVIDGDTLYVSLNKNSYNKFKEAADTEGKKSNLNDKYQSIKFRIGSIDTEESVHRTANKNTVGGKEASKYLAGWAEKQTVKYACYQHGFYGRPICSVSVNGKDIGETMIANGYSNYVTKYGRHPFLDKEYRKAELVRN
jgi:endonuclease YncB( thermonuclease family)